MRSLASGLKNGLQNLPTIVMILNQCYEKYALENKNTKAKEYLTMLQKLRDPRFLLLLVGLAQILELYCEVILHKMASL